MSLNIFIGYKRNMQPDEHVLKRLETQLSAHGHRVFIDRHLTIGMEWAKEIEQQIRNADAVIPLLSAPAVQSEMLLYEVEMAHDASKRQNGKPRLLPVRVGFTDRLPHDLASILDPIQHFAWEGPQDNQRLVSEIVNALGQPSSSASPALPAHRLEPVIGAVPLDSQLYVTRPTDEAFYHAVARQDSIVLIKGARQMGKTSLLARGVQLAREAGYKVVLTDFQKLNAAQLSSVDAFYRALCDMIAGQLELDVYPEQVWDTYGGGPNSKFERYLRREVLGKLSGSLLWGMDEVDRLFLCDFSSDVFGLLRSWHNERALNPTGPWERLTLAIAYATEAHLFITDLNQSPFNVGTRLALRDFTLEQVQDLNRRYGNVLHDESEVEQLYQLVGGQPYLTRRALNEIKMQNLSFAELTEQAARDEGLFGDHLRRILVSLAQDETLCDMIRDIIRGQAKLDLNRFYRLRSAGILSGETAREARLRCQLYATYLEHHL
jgi:hypothetical protein